MKLVGIVSLEDLSKRYEYLLFDASALGFSFKGMNRAKNDSALIIRSKTEIKHFNYLKDFLRRGGKIYLTNEVKEEILVPSQHFNKKPGDGFYISVRKKEIGARSRFSDGVKYKNSKFYNKIFKKIKKIESLYELIKENDGIVEFSETEKNYDSFLEYKHGRMKRKPWGKKRGILSSTDFKLVNSSFVFAKYRGSTCLVSNDEAAFWYWDFLSNREKCKRNDVNFSTRHNIDIYALGGFLNDLYLKQN